MTCNPKRIQGVRETKQIRFYQRENLRGRPKGSLKKRKFEETRLGFLLKYEAPLEYQLIMEATPKEVFPKPSAELVEIIARVSTEPVFKKKKFFRYLKEYRETGIYPRRGKVATPERLAYYKRLERNKNSQYQAKNRKRMSKWLSTGFTDN